MYVSKDELKAAIIMAREGNHDELSKIIDEMVRACFMKFTAGKIHWRITHDEIQCDTVSDTWLFVMKYLHTIDVEKNCFAFLTNAIRWMYRKNRKVSAKLRDLEQYDFTENHKDRDKKAMDYHRFYNNS